MLLGTGNESLIAHSSCSTVEAIRLAVQSIVKEDGDDYFVFLVSDANIERYGIKPQDIQKELLRDARFQLFAS